MIFEKINPVEERLCHLASRREPLINSLKRESGRLFFPSTRNFRRDTVSGRGGRRSGGKSRREHEKKKVDRLFVCCAQPHGVFIFFRSSSISHLISFIIIVSVYKRFGITATVRIDLLTTNGKLGKCKFEDCLEKKIKPPEKSIKPGYFYAGY